jgi:hypothetical protein
MNNNDINNKKQNKIFLLIPYFFIILTLLFIFFIIVSKVYKDHLEAEELRTHKTIKKEEFNFFFKPYLTYQDKEGNTIREYNFFPGMKPTGKDHKGRLNYFSFQEFIENCKKYNFNTFPVIMGEGSENIWNIEYEKGEEKKINRWKVSKANFNLILTNKSDNSFYNMTKSTSGNFDDYNGFVNKSICFLDNKTFLDFLEEAKERPSEFDKYTHMRFVTKNLETEFDFCYFWLNNSKYGLNYIEKATKNYKKIFNNIYVKYLQYLNNENLLYEIKDFNNEAGCFQNIELKEKEIFYNKTNKYEKRYILKKIHDKKIYDLLINIKRHNIRDNNIALNFNPIFQNFDNLNKNFESHTPDYTKQPEDTLI